MKKLIALLMVCMSCSGMSYAKQECALLDDAYLSSLGIEEYYDPVYLEAGTVLASTEHTVLKTAFVIEGKYASTGIVQAAVNGQCYGVPAGITGTMNPRGVCIQSPPEEGTVYQIDVEKDGWIVVFGKLSSNKAYYVFEGTPRQMINSQMLSYTLGIYTDLEGTNQTYMYTLPADSQGMFSLDSPDFVKYSDCVSIRGIEKIILGVDAADVKHNGPGFIMFPVYQGFSYYVFAQGSKLQMNGYIFSDEQPQTVGAVNWLDENVEWDVSRVYQTTTTKSYKLSLGQEEIKKGCVNSVDIALENSDGIVGMQFDMLLPEGLAFDYDSMGELNIVPTTRLKRHSVAENYVDGVHRFVAYSSSNTAFGGNSGALFSVPMIVSDEVADGDVLTIAISGIELSPGAYEAAIKLGDFTCDLKVVKDKAPVDPTLFNLRTEDQLVDRGRVNKVPVTIHNVDEITAFQFDVRLGDGLTLARDAEGEVALEGTARINRHQLSCDGDGDVYRVVCYSGTNKSISDNDGVVLYLPVEVSDYLAEGDVRTIELTDIEFTSTEELKPITVQDYSASLTVGKSYILGDANGDGNVTVTDITYIVSCILGETMPGFVEEAADVNEDGRVTVTDIARVVNIILADI